MTAIFPKQCKVCGRKDGIVYHIKDNIWKKIVPTRLQKRFVCLCCFDNLAELEGIDYTDDIIGDIQFVGNSAYFKATVQPRKSP